MEILASNWTEFAETATISSNFGKSMLKFNFEILPLGINAQPDLGRQSLSNSELINQSIELYVCCTKASKIKDRLICN